MDMEKQKVKADAFRAMHRGARILLLPNAWDVASARVFVPGLRDAETIGRLVKDLQCPVNILAGPGFPSVPELQKLGVARVSVGSGAMRATLGLLRRLAEDLKTAGTYGALEGAISYADVNQMMQ